jgi:hypothetical protein
MRGRGKGDNLDQVGRTLKAQEEEIHIFLGYRVVGTGLGVPPEENPKILSVKQEGRSMRRREVKGEGGKSVSLPMSLKFDGKSNWKAFYAKFSRYAEVSEWTEGNAGTSYAGAWMVKPVNTMPSWLSVTRKWYIWTSYGN